MIPTSNESRGLQLSPDISEHPLAFDAPSTCPLAWTADDLTYHESAVEEYPLNKCYISAGLVEGHVADSVYFRLEKNNDPAQEVFVVLRPDELAALLSVGAHALHDWLLSADCPAVEEGLP